MFWSASSCSRAANATRSKIEGGSKSGRVTEIVDAVATLSCLSPKSVHDLEIWRDAISLLKCVYIATKTWPRDELYGLISQARRAAVSIPTNLAEGRGRGTPAEIRRFALIAMASAYELDTLLLIANELGYPSTNAIRDDLASIIRRIQSYIRYQESRAR